MNDRAPFPHRPARAGRAEIHFHVLPGIDDGPADLDESIHVACLACLEGTTTVVATPHVRDDHVTDVTQLPPMLREVREALHEERIELELLLGAELGHEMVGRLSA